MKFHVKTCDLHAYEMIKCLPSLSLDPVVASLAQDIFKELAQIEGCQGPMQMRLIPTLVSIMQAPPDKIPSGLCAVSNKQYAETYVFITQKRGSEAAGTVERLCFCLGGEGTSQEKWMNSVSPVPHCRGSRLVQSVLRYRSCSVGPTPY